MAIAKLALLTGVMALWASSVAGYPTYTDGGVLGTNCSACHGDFDSGNYVANSDGQPWGTDLMEAHKEFINSDCDVCHKSGPRGDVALNKSSGGAGLEPISCIGCHGRAADRIGDENNPSLCVAQVPVVGPCGDGAGLRQHHANNGIGVCTSCHVNDLFPLGEDLLPPYYAQQGTDPFYVIPTDPCNPPPDFPELLRSPIAGLDNDGDNIYDTADPDCAQAECGDGLDNDGDGLCDTATSACTDGSTPGDPGCGDANDLSERSPLLSCDDGIDNDGDGRIDFDPVTKADVAGGYTAGFGDPGCFAAGGFREDPQCQDGIDNDHLFNDPEDGRDFDAGVSSTAPPSSPDPNGADPQCSVPWRNCERASCRACGLGYELALLLVPLRWLHGRRRRMGV